MDLNTIFFIGPQGSGKGTQAKLLASRLDFFYWEMGAILRAVARESSPVGMKVKNLIDNGVLLQDEDLYEVVKSGLSQIPKAKGVIFDGIPRRMGQAEFLLNYLKRQGRNNFTTLFVNLDYDESIKRLLKRAEMEKRADDTLEKIQFRLKQYLSDTLPVIDYLKKETHFIEIDGRPAMEEVTESINRSLGLTQ